MPYPDVLTRLELRPLLRSLLVTTFVKAIVVSGTASFLLSRSITCLQECLDLATLSFWLVRTGGVSDTVIALTIRVPYVNSNSYLQEVLKSSCLYVLKDVLSSNSLDTVAETITLVLRCLRHHSIEWCLKVRHEAQLWRRIVLVVLNLIQFLVLILLLRILLYRQCFNHNLWCIVIFTWIKSNYSFQSCCILYRFNKFRVNFTNDINWSRLSFLVCIFCCCNNYLYLSRCYIWT